MAVYLFILFVSFYSVIYCKNIKKNGSLYFILFLLLATYAGLRYRVGTDSFMYEEMFDVFPEITELAISELFEYKLEPLFILYISICKSICNDYLFFQFTIAIIVNISFFRFFKNYSDHPFLCVFFYFLIFYLLLNCEFMRQALAISVFYLFAFPQLDKNKLTKYYLYCIPCCFLHNTIFICLLFPFLRTFQMSFKKLVISSTSFYLLMTFIPIFNILSMIVPDNMSAAYKIASYSARTTEGHNLNFFISKIYQLCILLGIFWLGKNNKFKQYTILYIFSVVLSLSNDIFSRLQYVLCPFYIILLSDATNYISKYSRSLVLRLSFISIITFIPTFMYYIHTYHGTRYKVYYKFFPYSTYLYPQKVPEREAIGGGEEQLLYIFK